MGGKVSGRAIPPPARAPNRFSNFRRCKPPNSTSTGLQIPKPTLSLERDVTELSKIRRKQALPRLLNRLAGQTAQVLNVTAAGASVGLKSDTAENYLLETFVVGEIFKQVSWMPGVSGCGHWGTHDGAEVDMVVERDDGSIVALEVKSGSRVRTRDFSGLRILRDELGDAFCSGAVLFTGERAYTAEDRIHVLPVDRLWTPQT